MQVADGKLLHCLTPGEFILMILFYWINNCICFGNIEDVEDSYNKLKQLFDCDGVGNMDEYIGCKVER